jgi:SAM-dependent methyltransferase
MAERPSGDRTIDSVAAYTTGADAYEREHADRREAQVKRFVDSLPVGSAILDVGCGPGRDLARFQAAGHRPVGVELNTAFVQRARRHAPVEEMDLRDLHRLVGTFDGVWAAACLVHLRRAEVADVLEQFGRLVRPGGRLHVSVRSTGRDGWLDEPDGRRWYSVWQPAAIEAAVRGAGFRIDEVIAGPYTEVWATRP